MITAAKYSILDILNEIFVFEGISVECQVDGCSHEQLTKPIYGFRWSECFAKPIPSNEGVTSVIERLRLFKHIAAV